MLLNHSKIVLTRFFCFGVRPVGTPPFYMHSTKISLAVFAINFYSNYLKNPMQLTATASCHLGHLDTSDAS